MMDALGSQSGDQHTKYLASGMDIQCGVALSLASRVLEDEDQRAEAVHVLREGLFDYIRQEQDYADSMEAIRRLRQRLSERVSASQFEPLQVQAEFQRIREQVARPASEVDLAKHVKTLEFERRAQRVLRGGEASQGPAEEHTVDGDIEVTHVQTGVLQDPFTLVPLKDPVANAHCGHNYERKSVLEVMKHNPRTKCPYTGCANREYLRTQDLVSNGELRRKIRSRAHPGDV